jgi:hypothetical protein
MDTNTLANRMSELGYDRRLPPAIGQLPAGSGHWAVPHAAAFGSVWNTASRAYPQAFDEAIRDSRTNALAIRRDAVVASALRKLYTPLVQLDWELTPTRPDDPRLKADAELLKRVLQQMPRPGFASVSKQFCESRFFGRYGVQFKYRWGYCDYDRAMLVDGTLPVNGDKIVFRYNGQPGILVNPHEFRGDVVPTERGACHFLDEAEREQFFWAEFEPEDADFYEPQFAGQVHGLGFRSKLYWPWWLREQFLQQVLRFLKRAANGYTVGFYDANNPGSEARLKAKLAAYTGEDFILFPRDRTEHSPYGLEHNAVPIQGSKVFLDLVMWVNDLIEDAILGEDLTTSSANTGLNSNQSETHEDTADMRTKYHAPDIELAWQEVVNVLARYNCPGRPAPRFSYLKEKRNAEEYMGAVDFAWQHGLAIEEDDVRDVLGLQAPREGKSVLAAMVPGQPAGIYGQPQGMPQSMPAGPMGGGGGMDPSMFGQPQQQYSRMSRRGQRDRRRAERGIMVREGQLYLTGA